VGAVVRQRRLELRWTQRRAAGEAGLSVATWQALERADPGHAFRSLTLARAAHALDLPIETLTGGPAPSTGGAPADQAATTADTLAAIVDDLGVLAAHAPDDLRAVRRLVAALVQPFGR
jgi:transcriptional regulator with XRE-family HTH domain